MFLASRGLGFPVRVLDLAMMGFTLEGGRVEPFDGRPGVLYVYRMHYDIAVDRVQAGDTVLVMDEGTGARQILGLDRGAIRAVVLGVVVRHPHETGDAVAAYRMRCDPDLAWQALRRGLPT